MEKASADTQKQDGATDKVVAGHKKQGSEASQKTSASKSDGKTTASGDATTKKTTCKKHCDGSGKSKDTKK